MTAKTTTPADTNEKPTSMELAIRHRLPAFYFLAQTLGQQSDLSTEEFIHFVSGYFAAMYTPTDTPKNIPKGAFDAAMDIVAHTHPAYLGLLLGRLDEPLMEMIKQDARTQFGT